jgi:hypothetical protein
MVSCIAYRPCWSRGFQRAGGRDSERPLHATTIHRAFGLKAGEADGPDEFVSTKKVSCGVLICDEMSMNSTPFVAKILSSTNAELFVFIGDENQPPIGPGKPYRDMIASGILPPTRLTKNWRTDCEGIRNLCADMIAFEAHDLSYSLPEYEEAGGVEFVQCSWSERAATTGRILKRLISEGADLEQIAILGPHNDGDAGCGAANVEARKVLSFNPQKIEAGDMLIVTKNNYRAPLPGMEGRIGGDLNAGATISTWSYPKTPKD